MAEFPNVTVDLSEQLEFPGDSYPLTGKVDVAAYTVGEKEYQLQDGIDYDVVFTNAGTGVLLTGMVRAHATGECDRCLEPASFDIAGEIEEFYLFNEPEDPEAYEDGYELLGEDRIVDLGEHQELFHGNHTGIFQQPVEQHQAECERWLFGGDGRHSAPCDGRHLRKSARRPCGRGGAGKYYPAVCGQQEPRY